MSAITKVAIDTRDLKKGKTGTYFYLQGLCNAFQKQTGEVQFYYIQYRLPVYQGNNKLGKLVEHFMFTIWKQIVLPLYCLVFRIDVLFCTDYFLPLIPMPTKKVVVFHDTFFYEAPEHYNYWWLKTFHYLAVTAAKKAAQIIVPTQYVQTKLIHYLPAVNGRVTVIYEGPKPLVQHRDAQWETEIEQWLGGSNYILHVGTLDHRKNLQNLVAAFEILIQQAAPLINSVLNNPTIKLIIAGDSPKYFSSNGKGALMETIQQKGLKKCILLTGRISETQLSYLYQNAYVYAFPSLNEGFGLPMLEAMQYQIPIAAANNSALPEVGAGAALYFDPNNVQAIASQINILIQDQEVRAQLKAAAKQRVALFNWDYAASQLKQIFIQVKNGKT